MTVSLAHYDAILDRFPPPRYADLPSGVKLAYREWGDAGLPPMILVHGITSSSLSWWRVAERLAGRYRVIATDNRGHGNSEAPERGYRFDDQAEDTAQLMASLGIERAVVMGHSWGGAIAVALAAGKAGGLVERLVLEDPLVGLSAERAASVGDGYVAQVGLTREEALAQLPGVIRPGWTEEDAAGKLFSMVRGHKHAVRAVFDENGGSDLRPRYAELRCPTLMVLAAPALGGIVPDATLAEIKRLNPSLRVTVVDGADHNVHRTKFDQFVTTLEPFLAGS